MLKRTLRILFAVIAIFMISAWHGMSVAAAAESTTFRLVNVTETVPAFNSCIGPMVGTLTYDGVVHLTVSDDFYHAVVGVHGDSVVVPLNPAQPSFSGKFSEISVLHLNRNNAVETFVVTQLADGMKFHISFQLVVDNTGAPKVFVLNIACG